MAASLTNNNYAVPTSARVVTAAAYAQVRHVSLSALQTFTRTLMEHSRHLDEVAAAAPSGEGLPGGASAAASQVALTACASMATRGKRVLLFLKVLPRGKRLTNLVHCPWRCRRGQPPGVPAWATLGWAGPCPPWASRVAERPLPRQAPSAAPHPRPPMALLPRLLLLGHLRSPARRFRLPRSGRRASMTIAVGNPPAGWVGSVSSPSR